MKKKILIANSFRDALERERSILSRSSFEIFTTLSGTEAVALHKAHGMDLIIASLDLPDMGGDNLCSVIRKDKELKNVSIILTCANHPGCIERAAGCGANAYLTKPFHSEQLTEKVTALLSIPRRQNYRVLLKASVKGAQTAEAFYCSSIDISISGMLLETERQMRRGDRLSISFVLPGFGQISVEGEIMRIDARGTVTAYGVRFGYLERSQREALEKFIASRSSQTF